MFELRFADPARVPMVIDAEEFIGLKSFKARGKRLTTFALEQVMELEPKRVPEPDNEEDEENSEVPAPDFEDTETDEEAENEPSSEETPSLFDEDNEENE